GAENPTVVFYDEKAYRNQRLGEQTVAHETAHQWFGDAVTEADWHHLWLSEGFATYYAALWIRQADGDSAFRAVMARNAQSVMKSDATMRPILDTLATDLMGLLNSNNYPKGAWVLHSLRGVVGDSAYHRGIREWYGRYRHATALSSDFAAVMAEAADADLTWYFEQALLRPGYPRLEVRWRRKGRDLRLDLRQVQPAEWGIRRLPGLELEVDGRRVVVDVTGAETSVTLAGVRGDPKSIRVDPDGWWLMESTVEKSR
ncbi:MAG: M1 family aminopeptidase, partial [Gemmatimonadota bacterium]|nr:M1 family aminopeptidase [Gemmatimonadota bacterium]